MYDIFRKKDIALLTPEESQGQLKRTMGMLDMILLGIGCVIGTGIFVITGVAAAENAGPGIIISFIISGLACLFTALAYAELASMVPVAGTVYAYSYASIGEIAAWITGWCLILEYSVGASVVAAGWSGCMASILMSFGIKLPRMLSTIPAEGGLINLPAVVIVLALTLLLVRGTRESALLNKVLVAIKLLVVVIFILLALPFINTANWTPFMPFGVFGIAQGAAIIFFAYTGFDAVATAAEECHNPRRDLPAGIIVSLLICTILYIVVATVLTGVVPYQELDNAAPVTYALSSIGKHLGATIVGVGAITGITTVLLVLMYGQSRIMYSMSRDGLIPKGICEVHKHYGTPYKVTVLIGLFVALVAGFMPLGDMAKLANIGILFPFIIASMGALILRVTNPNADRPFRCPFLLGVALLSIFSCSFLMFSLDGNTWLRFIGWLALGAIFYFAYGYRNSHLGKKRRLGTGAAVAEISAVSQVCFGDWCAHDNNVLCQERLGCSNCAKRR
jgi:APA family basic amino acid/polyamine antiporter